MMVKILGKMWNLSIMVIFGLFESSFTEMSCTKTYTYSSSSSTGEVISFDAKDSLCYLYDHDIMIEPWNEDKIIELEWETFEIHGNMPDCTPAGEEVALYTG